MKTHFEMNYPKLRAGVQVEFLPNSVVFNYRDQSCDLNYQAISEQRMRLLVDALKTGEHGIEALASQWLGADPEAVSLCETLTTELDRNGLLVDGNVLTDKHSLSGKQFYHDILKLFDSLKMTHANSAFYNLLVAGKASLTQLIGYAMEYYHLVKLAPGIIGPALAKAETKKTRKYLQDFLRSELYHDKLLEKSLESVGINLDELEYIQPLPSTFAICSALAVYAQQHPLTFKSALFLFETASPEFNQAFAQCALSLNMPSGFYKPILKHAQLNDDGDHGSISHTLLQDVAVISAEEQIIVKKHLTNLIEHLFIQEKEIIHYYANQTDFTPRLFY